MRVVSTVIMNAENNSQSQIGTIYFDVNQMVNMTFQTSMGDVSSNGTVKIQGSNDEPTNGNRQTFIPTNWSDIPNATATVTSGIAPLIVLSNISCQYVRAVYTKTSGGTTTITITANGAGA